jgi:hypothetical protein
MWRIGCLLVVVLGCGNQGASQGAARCEKIVGALWDRIAAKDHASDPDHAGSPEMDKLFKQTMTTSCKNDGWSDKLIACLEPVNDDDGLFGCLDKHMTGDQASALRRALTDAFTHKLEHDHPVTAPVRIE